MQDPAAQLLSRLSPISIASTCVSMVSGFGVGFSGCLGLAVSQMISVLARIPGIAMARLSRLRRAGAGGSFSSCTLGHHDYNLVRLTTVTTWPLTSQEVKAPAAKTKLPHPSLSGLSCSTEAPSHTSICIPGLSRCKCCARRSCPSASSKVWFGKETAAGS